MDAPTSRAKPMSAASTRATRTAKECPLALRIRPAPSRALRSNSPCWASRATQSAAEPASRPTTAGLLIEHQIPLEPASSAPKAQYQWGKRLFQNSQAPHGVP